MYNNIYCSKFEGGQNAYTENILYVNLKDAMVIQNDYESIASQHESPPTGSEDPRLFTAIHVDVLIDISESFYVCEEEDLVKTYMRNDRKDPFCTDNERPRSCFSDPDVVLHRISIERNTTLSDFGSDTSDSLPCSGF
jgi:hypothetical protein